jgi:hypothetical protein
VSVRVCVCRPQIALHCIIWKKKKNYWVHPSALEQERRDFYSVSMGWVYGDYRPLDREGLQLVQKYFIKDLFERRDQFTSFTGSCTFVLVP